MNEIVKFARLDAFSLQDARSIHLAIGMFDGVHLGHQRVLDSAKRRAKEAQGIAGALSFWPHPSRLFRPDAPVRMILNPEQKAREFAHREMSFVIQEPFTLEFSEIEADAFLDYLLARIPNLKSVHTGLNWEFGKERKGDAALLERLADAAGIEAQCVEVHNIGGERVSSTRIRELLGEGAIEQANRMLGYRYYSFGSTVEGRKLGTDMGTPTLNMPFEGDLRPAYGVYTTLVSELSSQRQYKAVANFGVRPTVERSDKPILEVHLLEDCPFGYGCRLRVEWLAFIRAEQAFASVDELKIRIQNDVEIANELFARL